MWEHRRTRVTGQDRPEGMFPIIGWCANASGCDRPCRGGRSKDWVKVKNRQHPAMARVKEAFYKP
jgi:hypothetical protein